jgi:hypothetical protein
VGGIEVVQIAGRGWQDRLARECRPGRILVTGREVRAPPAGGCLLLDAGALARSGALAGRSGPDGRLVLTTAAEVAGRRLWTGAAPGGDSDAFGRPPPP